MLEIELVLKLIIAAILGGVVGIEREMTRRPAGLRTHMLVSLGACLFTIISVSYFTADQARVAAAVVTGIGFIGAGTIISTRTHVKGITTAASLWVVSAIGMTVGVGSYILAVSAAIIVFVILQARKVEEDLKNIKQTKTS